MNELINMVVEWDGSGKKVNVAIHERDLNVAFPMEITEINIEDGELYFGNPDVNINIQGYEVTDYMDNSFILERDGKVVALDFIG